MSEQQSTPGPHPYDDGMASARPIVPSRIAPGGVVHGTLRRPTTRLAGFVALAKLRVVELLLMTTVPTMVLAERGWPSTWLVVVTLIGVTTRAGDQRPDHACRNAAHSAAV